MSELIPQIIYASSEIDRTPIEDFVSGLVNTNDQYKLRERISHLISMPEEDLEALYFESGLSNLNFINLNLDSEPDLQLSI